MHELVEQVEKIAEHISSNAEIGEISEYVS